jgi:hypothetical protein
MKVVQHTSTNDVTVGDGTCDPVPCTRTELAGMETLTTYWELDPAERAVIAAGGLVRIEVMGGSMPPISARVEPIA